MPHRPPPKKHHRVEPVSPYGTPTPKGKEAKKKKQADAQLRAAKQGVPVCVAKPRQSEAFHGETRDIPYHWLRDRKDPAVREYLKEETAFAEKMIKKNMGNTAAKLEEEMDTREQDGDALIPYYHDGYYYYTRSEMPKEGDQKKKKSKDEDDVKKPKKKGSSSYESSSDDGSEDEEDVYCRRPAKPDEDFILHCANRFRRRPGSILPKSADEEVLLDLNFVKLHEECKNVDCACCLASDDGKLVLAALDLTEGTEDYSVSVYDMNSNRLKRRIKGKKGSGECCWGTNNVFFYVELDDKHRSYRLWRHDLRKPEDTANDLIFEERDTTFEIVNILRTPCKKYLCFETCCNQSSEYRAIPIANCEESRVWKVLYPRTPMFEYSATFHPKLDVGGLEGPHWIIFQIGRAHV